MWYMKIPSRSIPIASSHSIFSSIAHISVDCKSIGKLWLYGRALVSELAKSLGHDEMISCCPCHSQCQCLLRFLSFEKVHSKRVSSASSRVDTKHKKSRWGTSVSPPHLEASWLETAKREGPFIAMALKRKGRKSQVLCATE